MPMRSWAVVVGFILALPCLCTAELVNIGVDDEKHGISKNAPNYWACLDPIAKNLPYCDPSLPIDLRVADLRNRLTLKEKIAAISPNPDLGDPCCCHTANISRVGLPSYMWLVETNTMVGSKCLPDKCATQFPGPLSMAASFNRTSWHLKGRVFGTEQRALMNLNQRRDGEGEMIGFTAYGPNINQQRDPRFGRSSELPGEDPYLSGQYAKHMVLGMQEKDGQGRPKVLAYLKHFAAYSRETDRGSDTYNISMYDLFDTYLPQFETALVEANATGVMCSYNGINGRPSCANDFLLNQVLRKRWKRPLAHVTTDCGAVHKLAHAPAWAPDNATGAAWALMNGTDLEMGSTWFNENLYEAVQRGLATGLAVDVAFSRSYRPHFVAGRFDDITSSPWTALGESHIFSPYHQQIQLEAALQGIVLLKHDLDHPVLPLKAGQQIVAVLGPLAHTRDLMSDYWGDQICVGGGFDCVPTLAESIRTLNPQRTVNAKGVDVNSTDTTGIPSALALADTADVIVLCLGITRDQEHEGIDRSETALPGLQEQFAHQVFKLGKPVVLVFVNGGQVAMDNLVQGAAAVVEAFNPNSIGGTALSQLLFGVENRWGKLPYTIYPHSVMQSFDMESYDMSAPPGRTYRYFTGRPIYSFGYGLSLTKFEVDCRSIHPPDDEGRAPRGGMQSPVFASSDVLHFVCTIFNVGDMKGDEVVQFYAQPSQSLRARATQDHPIPLLSLVEFARVSDVESGDFKQVEVHIPVEKAFSLINQKGDRVLYSGQHNLLITNGVLRPLKFNFAVTPSAGTVEIQ